MSEANYDAVTDFFLGNVKLTGLLRAAIIRSIVKRFPDSTLHDVAVLSVATVFMREAIIIFEELGGKEHAASQFEAAADRLRNKAHKEKVKAQSCPR